MAIRKHYYDYRHQQKVYEKRDSVDLRNDDLQHHLNVHQEPATILSLVSVQTEANVIGFVMLKQPSLNVSLYT